MTLDLQKLKERADAVIAEGGTAWFSADGLADKTGLDIPEADADFIAAVSPETTLALIAELEKAQKDANDMSSLLPSVYYMDLPDGGNVSVIEQFRRMAKDAERYRDIRSISIAETGMTSEQFNAEITDAVSLRAAKEQP